MGCSAAPLLHLQRWHLPPPLGWPQLPPWAARPCETHPFRQNMSQNIRHFITKVTQAVSGNKNAVATKYGDIGLFCFRNRSDHGLAINSELLEECRSAHMPVTCGDHAAAGGPGAAAVRGHVLRGHPLSFPIAPAFPIPSPWALPGSASDFPCARADFRTQTWACSHPSHTAKGWRSTETTRLQCSLPRSVSALSV